MKLIQRHNYLERLIKVIGTPDIKVITGIRRSGKSKLLNTFKDYLETNITNVNIIHINFNLPEWDELLTYIALYGYINDNYKSDCHNFILIDEVQMCEDFERAINGLHALERYDIYVTGSNAFLLSSDLATLFTGRTFEINIFPFSFQEYLNYFDGYDNIYDAFDSYLETGGMSGSYLYQEVEDRNTYLSDVYDTLILRDIYQKYQVRNIDLLDKISNFLMDNVGNLTSPHNISNILIAKQNNTNNKTVSSYIQYLCNTFLFYKVRRYDVRGKKYLNTSEKYYLVDAGFRYAKLGTRNMDYGRMIENIVAIELLRRGYEVYVGVLYEKEIDFVAIKRDEKLYIQVSDNISDEKTFNREVTPLLAINDAYSKILIARTRHKQYDYEGIKIIDVATWLNNTL